MKAIKILITRFIDDHQPGFVECRFYDALGKEHIVQEKLPVVTNIYLDANSTYPQEGVIACEIVKEKKDKTGKKILTVNTKGIWHVDTIEDLTEFDLLEEQLIDYFK